MLKREDAVSLHTVNPTQDVKSMPVSPQQNQSDNNLVHCSDTRNLGSDECKLTELKSFPVNNQSSAPISSASVVSTSFFLTAEDVITNVSIVDTSTTVPSVNNLNIGYSDASLLEETSNSHECFSAQQVEQEKEEEYGELFFHEDEVNNDDFEAYSEIQQCLSLNRDYQVMVYVLCHWST